MTGKCVDICTSILCGKICPKRSWRMMQLQWKLRCKCAGERSGMMRVFQLEHNDQFALKTSLLTRQRLPVNLQHSEHPKGSVFSGSGKYQHLQCSLKASAAMTGDIANSILIDTPERALIMHCQHATQPWRTSRSRCPEHSSDVLGRPGRRLKP